MDDENEEEEDDEALATSASFFDASASCNVLSRLSVRLFPGDGVGRASIIGTDDDDDDDDDDADADGGVSGVRVAAGKNTADRRG